MSNSPFVRPGTPLHRRHVKIAVALATVLALAAPAAHAAELTASPATLSSTFAAAQGGDVIRLTAGDYGTFKGGSKPAAVTLTPASGASAKLYADLGTSQNLVLDGLTVNGGVLNGARNVTIRNSAFTAMLQINTPSAAGNANIVIDHNTFTGINVCGTCAEGRLTVRGYDNTAPVGVTISNNLFGPGGDADGVQIIGAPFGVQIGPGNEFRGLAQVSAAHTDPVQLYGSSHTLITGNWMHDNATGIMAPDTSDHETIVHNVIQTTGYPWPIVLGGATGATIAHNTLPGKDGTVEVDKANNGTASTGVVVKDNVVSGVTNASGGKPTGIAADYNLMAGGTLLGAHDLKGKPTFSGGATPTGYPGFDLASGTPGAGAASDGADMGIVLDPASVPPAPAPALPAPNGPAATQGTGPLTVVRLAQPLPGARFSSVLRAAATATDTVGVDRLGFWLDRRWIGTARKAPYRVTWRVARRIGYRSHTLTVRAFAADGRVSSLGVTVRRVHRRSKTSARRAAANRGWTLSSRPTTNGTRLTGKGRPHRRVRVVLTRCNDQRARTARRTVLRADRKGAVGATVRRTNLCVLRLQAL